MKRERGVQTKIGRKRRETKHDVHVCVCACVYKRVCVCVCEGGLIKSAQTEQ